MYCHHLPKLIPRLLLALLATYSHISAAAAAGEADDQRCYGINGELRPSTVQPCNKNRAAGTHVACCDLGKVSPDICIGGGLCYNQEGTVIADMLVAQGCTDPTGADPACQQFCENGGAVTYNLHACEDARWCCSSKGVKCCGLRHFDMDPRNVLPIARPVTYTVTEQGTGTAGAAETKTGAATVVTTTKTEIKTVKVDAAGQTTAVTGATEEEECPKDNTTVVGASVGGVLGAGLLASLLALGLVLRRQKKGVVVGVGADGKPALYYPAGMVPAEMDSRYVVELDSRAKHELEGNGSQGNGSQYGSGGGR